MIDFNELTNHVVSEEVAAWCLKNASNHVALHKTLKADAAVASNPDILLGIIAWALRTGRRAVAKRAFGRYRALRSEYENASFNETGVLL